MSRLLIWALAALAGATLARAQTASYSGGSPGRTPLLEPQTFRLSSSRGRLGWPHIRSRHGVRGCGLRRLLF